MWKLVRLAGLVGVVVGLGGELPGEAREDKLLNVFNIVKAIN